MARPSGHDTTTDARRSHSSRPFPRTDPPRASETSHGAMSGAMVPKASSFTDLGDSDGRLRGNDGNGNHPQNNRAAAASLAPRRRVPRAASTRRRRGPGLGAQAALVGARHRRLLGLRRLAHPRPRGAVRTHPPRIVPYPHLLTPSKKEPNLDPYSRTNTHTRAVYMYRTLTHGPSRSPPSSPTTGSCPPDRRCHSYRTRGCGKFASPQQRRKPTVSIF